MTLNISPRGSMKVLVIGTVEFTRSMLDKLLTEKINVCGLISMSSSKHNSDFFDFNNWATQNNIQHLQTVDINSPEVRCWIQKLKPDLIFCLGWSRLINSDILLAPKYGTIGYHPAELPMNRGRHPIIWALALGLHQTASTFFVMDEGPDSGDIVSQEIVSISRYDDAGSLYSKLTLAASSQIVDLCRKLESGTITRKKQDQSLANFWRKRTKTDGLIDFRMNSESIYNLVRALRHPYPGAYLMYESMEVKIWKVAELSEERSNIEPGKVLEVTGNLIKVKTADGAISIIDHEFYRMPHLGEYL